MKISSFSPATSHRQAVEQQRELASRVRLERLPGPIKRIAGTDAAFEIRSKVTVAAVVVLDAQDFRRLECVIRMRPTDFPYIPGLLSYREIPALLDCFESLQQEPDLIICDGQGIAHPRGMGLAAHLGLILNTPTVGCAKSRLVGEYVDPDLEKGSVSPLLFHGRRVGSVVRTRQGVKPVFVSPGHRVTIEEAVEAVLSATTRYRLPEPIRLAHREAGKFRKKFTESEMFKSSGADQEETK